MPRRGNPFHFLYCRWAGKSKLYGSGWLGGNRIGVNPETPPGQHDRCAEALSWAYPQPASQTLTFSVSERSDPTGLKTPPAPLSRRITDRSGPTSL